MERISLDFKKKARLTFSIYPSPEVRSKFPLECSMTRWLHYFSNIWSFTTMEICPIAQHFCQNKPSKNCRRHLKFCQWGEILPILVPLLGWRIWTQHKSQVWSLHWHSSNAHQISRSSLIQIWLRWILIKTKDLY